MSLSLLFPTRVSRYRRAILVSAVAVAILFLTIYGIQQYRLNIARNVIAGWGDHPGETIYLTRLPALLFENLVTGRTEHITFTPGTDSLLVFLSPADCWGCMGELPAWKNIKSQPAGKDIDETFIFVNTSKSEVLSVARQGLFSPNARLYLDKDNSGGTLSRLNIPSTPFTVLIRGTDRRVLAVEGPDGSPGGQEQFVSSVVRIITLTK